MPNWCKNNLRIRNNKNGLELLELLEDEKGEITFSKAVPMPSELNDTTSPVPDNVPQKERDRLIKLYGSDNWYDWRLKNWGCKWDASEGAFYAEDNDWMATFQTPWSPPIEFLRTLSKMYPDVEFELQYADESEECQPIGIAYIQNGAVEYDGPEENTGKARTFGEMVWSESWIDDWTTLTDTEPKKYE